MKFHHKQKVKVISGYYKTYKGIVKEIRMTKENRTEYQIDLYKKKSEEPIEKWLPEDYLRAAWF